LRKEKKPKNSLHQKVAKTQKDGSGSGLHVAVSAMLMDLVKTCIESTWI